MTLKRSDEWLTFKNIGYNSFAKILIFIFSAISNIVLGRCLVASDYGIVSFAFIFVNFIGNFADLGIGPAIIQRKELDRPALYTAFTLKFFLGCAVIVAAFVLSALAPLFFDNPQIGMIIRLISLYFMIGNFTFLPSTLLMRDMDFKKISIAEITLSLLHSLAAIVLALKGYGYWSIVVAYLFANTISALMLAMFRPVAVRFYFDRKIAREIVSFGGYLFLSGLFTFLIFNLDNFIIGMVKGSKDLGYYAIAYNWGSVICGIMYSVVLRAVFPFLTKIQDEEQEIRKTYLKTLEYSGYLVVLANVVLFIISKEFLICILGHNSNKWLPALTSLRIFCIYGILRGLLEPIGSVIIANGKTKTMMVANMIASIIEIAAVYPALKYYGIDGVACAVTVAYLSQYAIYYVYIANNLQIKMGNLAKAVKPSFYAALPVLLLYLIFSGYYAGTFMLILVKVAIVVIIYVATLGVITNWALLKIIRNYVLRDRSVKDAAC